MRCSPCANHPALAEYDNSVRKGICAITNLDLSDLQWLQASIPVKEGGLGVRRVTSLAPSAFLASAASTDVLQQQLLLHSPTVATTDTAVSLAKNIAAHKEPPGLLRTESKRPDGVTLLLWKNGRYATWDVTVTDTMAQFYLHNTSRTSGAAAEAAADKKTAKIRSCHGVEVCVELQCRCIRL